jgi:hypothetical protein
MFSTVSRNSAQKRNSMGSGSGVQVGRLGLDARRSARSVPRHLGIRSRPSSTAPRRRNPAFGRGRLRSEEVGTSSKGGASSHVTIRYYEHVHRRSMGYCCWSGFGGGLGIKVVVKPRTRPRTWRLVEGFSAVGHKPYDHGGISS